MTTTLEKTGYCPSHKSYEMHGYHKYDLDLWKRLLVGREEPTDVELKAELGRQIVSGLPLEFISNNHGRFVAVNFARKILTVCDTLETLNKEIVRKDVKENYYIARIGYTTIAQI